MSDNPSVLGVWRLRSCYVEKVQSGERFEPYGANPKGVIILHPEGRMVVLITPSEQKPATTDAEKAEALQKLVAYSGTYRLEPPNRFIIAVDISWFPPWLGTEQARNFSLNGDTLDITTDPTTSPYDGVSSVVGVLSWVRDADARFA